MIFGYPQPVSDVNSWGNPLEVRNERDARQVAIEVVGELGATAGMVQQAALSRFLFRAEPDL